MKTPLLASAALLSTLALVSQVIACGDKDPDDGGTGTIDDGGSSDGGTGVDGGASDGGTADGGSSDGGTPDGGTADGGSAGSVTASISGFVQVQLYENSADDGERVHVEWADSVFGDRFPFGAIFVSATQDDDEGGLYYRGSDTVSSPSVAGDAYSMTVTLPESGGVGLYATLDYADDGIISTAEPIGTFPGEVELTEGAEAGDKDIVILINYEAAIDWWGGGDGGGDGGDGGGAGDGGGGGDGGGEGGCSGAISLQGSATVASDWTGGDVAVLLYDLLDAGPYYYDRRTPTALGSGAEAPFSIELCGSPGTMQVLGAWDSNGNGLIDPADTWGEYITKPDVSGNPLDIVGDTSDMEVQIPLGDGRSGLDIVPFSSLSGSLSYWGGASFDKLPADSVVYLVALLYRPEGGIEVSTLSEEAYDSAAWTGADYAGATSLPFTLWVPSDSIVYLWAYVDEGPKPDGMVNTPGEIVGSGGDDSSGRMATGSGSTVGLSVDLGHAR